ncbi:MlaA family lipoprotein [Humidesulfovibrio sp.]
MTLRTLLSSLATRMALLLLLFVVLAGCGATRQAPEHTLAETSFRVPKSRAIDAQDAQRIEQESMLYVYDPLERMNRLTYNFNARFDRAVFVPVVTAYQKTFPRSVRTGVSNFIGNLNEVPHLANSALQANQNKVNTTIIRLFTNTVLGVGGLFDVATDLGFEREDEDFGQTLSVWGVPDGAYIVLPFYGPSNARDTAGTAGDMVFSYYQMEYLFDIAGVSDHALARNINTGVRALNSRSEVPFRYYTTDTPFEYDILRFAYTRARVLQALD